MPCARCPWDATPPLIPPRIAGGKFWDNAFTQGVALGYSVMPFQGNFCTVRQVRKEPDLQAHDKSAIGG